MLIHTRPTPLASLTVCLVLSALSGCGGGSSGASTSAGAGASAGVPAPTAAVPETPSSAAPSPAPSPGPGPAPAPSPSPGNLALSVATSRVSGVAPLSVFFDATGTTSSGATSLPFHDIKYTWNFGDAAGGATWATGSRPGQLSKNSAQGPIAGHLFETPGTYTVTLTAFDGTHTSSQTITITVDNPNTVFSGSNTICVANGTLPVAGAGGCPAGATVRNVATLPAVTALATGNKRILLKRGDTWAVPDTGWINASNNQFAAYGSGPAPKIQFSGTSAYGFASNVNMTLSNLSFMDIDFGGIPPQITTGNTAFTLAGNNMTILRATGTGVSGFASLGNGDNLFVVDSDFSGFVGGYGHGGIWAADVTRLAILGTRIYDCTQVEHNIRTQGAIKAVYSANSLGAPAATKHALTVRGLNTKWTEHVVISDNAFTGGPMGAGEIVEIAPEASSHYEPLRDIIFERNHISGNVGTGLLSEVSHRASYRNNIFDLNGASGAAAGITVTYKNTASVPPPDSHYIYNNSFYYSGSVGFSGVAAYSLNGTNPSGTIVKNNLVYAPNALSTGFNSGTQAVALFSSLSTNVASNNSTHAQVRLSPGLGATPPTAALATWKPSVGSYAIGSGAVPALPLWEDFFGVTRTGTNDMGAVVH